jgi:hypothetical protein
MDKLDIFEKLSACSGMTTLDDKPMGKHTKEKCGHDG